MSRKESQFIVVDLVPNSGYVTFFDRGTNRAISKEDLFDQIKDEVFSAFIYPTIALLQAANLEADEDRPSYVRVEETQYRLYKITSLAPGPDDIVLNNGATAKYQVEYRDIGFVIGPETSSVNAIALYNNTEGTELKNGPVLSDVGASIVSLPNLTEDSYIKINSDETAELRTISQVKTDLSLPSSTIDDVNERVVGPGSSLDEQIALFDGITGKSIKAGQSISKYALTINTYSEISTTQLSVGQRIRTNGHTVAGLGYAEFIGKSGSVTDDGGTQKNSATPGVYAEMIPQGRITPEMFGCTSSSTAIEATRAINKAYVYASANKDVVVMYEQINYPLDGIIDGTADISSFGTRGGIQVKSNTVTEFSGQIFTQAATSSQNYSLINCSGSSNFVIRGNATFIGDALIHLGATGEWGHGLYLADSHNFKISGLTVKTCWGDGVYVSCTNEDTLALGESTSASNGVISDCIFDSNRRQGNSLVNCKEIDFDRCQFVNTGYLISTNPAAGLDVEPDASPNSYGVRKIRFNSCMFDNNQGPNVLLFPNIPTGCVDIAFNNCSMLRTNAQGSFWSDRVSTNVKNITVNGGIIEGGVYSGNGTTFNNVRISKSMTDTHPSQYAIEMEADSFGASYNGCEILAIGDTTVNSKKLLFVPTGLADERKATFNKCRFVAVNTYGGATNILMVTRSPVTFGECEFTTEGTPPVSYVGFDTTAGNARVGLPQYAMLYNCFVSSTWHSGVPSLQGRVSNLISKVRTATASASNNIPIATSADVFVVNYASGGATTINNPTDPYTGKVITIVQRNASVVALGVTTWGSAYKMSAWTNPAAGFSRSITFYYDGTDWNEIGRTTADIPN